MDIFTLTVISLILVSLLYVKWLIVIVFLPLQILYSYGYDNTRKLIKTLYISTYKLINKISKGGVERFCIYTMSDFPSCKIRLIYYRLIGARIDKNVVFHFKTEIRNPIKLFVGKGTIIGDNAILDARRGLCIGSNVNISSNVSIWSLQHNHRSPYFDCSFPDRDLSVRIGNRAWLGCNVVVLPGVTIGEGAVVCAGAVVTKDVCPYSVVAGIPAKEVARRPENLLYEFKGKSCWFY